MRETTAVSCLTPPPSRDAANTPAASSAPPLRLGREADDGTSIGSFGFIRHKAVPTMGVRSGIAIVGRSVRVIAWGCAGDTERPAAAKPGAGGGGKGGAGGGGKGGAGVGGNG